MLIGGMSKSSSPKDAAELKGSPLPESLLTEEVISLSSDSSLTLLPECPPPEEDEDENPWYPGRDPLEGGTPPMAAPWAPDGICA